MKQAAQVIRHHCDGIGAGTRIWQTNAFLNALSGLFQAGKRRAKGYGRFSAMRTVALLPSRELDYVRLNPHNVYLNRNAAEPG